MQRKIIIKMFISFTVIGRLFFAFKNHRKSRSHIDPLTFFIGNWHISDPDIFVEMSIRIEKNQQIYLNNQLMNGDLVSIEKDGLVFKDHFGYDLVVSKLSDNTLNLFDEADEKNYQLIRQSD